MSDPVRVVATLRCKPGKGDEAVLAVRRCVAATRQEAGCIEYAAYRSDDAPDRITVVELWQSLQALEEHKRTPHLQALVEAVKDLAAAPLEVLVLTDIG